MEREQAQAREQFERDCRAREEQMEGQRRELEQQRELLQGSVAQVAQKLADNRDSLVQHFLTIVPLFRQLDLLPDRNGLPAKHHPVGVPPLGGLPERKTA